MTLKQNILQTNLQQTRHLSKNNEVANVMLLGKNGSGTKVKCRKPS